MNYVKFITHTNNSLFVQSMSKLHKVSHLAFNDEGHKALFDKKMLVCVAHLPNTHDVQVMAQRYDGDKTTVLENKSSEGKSFSQFYIKAFNGKFYQVAAVFNNLHEANQFMLDREDVAIIDSTNFNRHDNQYYFIASFVASKVIR